MKPAKPNKDKPAKILVLCRDELERATASGNLSTRFRPVVSLESCRVFSHFARVFGPPDSSMRDLAHYFALAQELDLVEKLGKAYFDAVLSRFKNGDAPGDLLLPLPTACLEDLGDDVASLLGKALKRHGVAASRVTLVYPGAFSAPPANRSLMKELRRLDVGLAAEGIGCALDESAFLADWAPGLLLLDECHLADVDGKSESLDRLQELIRAEAARGRMVLAQGVNTMSQFHLIRELGIGAASGDFFGKFSSRPYDLLSAAAFQAIDKLCGSTVEMVRESGGLLERLLIKRSPVGPEARSEDVFRTFECEPDLRAIAVVKDDLPVGLISRYEMIDKMARPFRHELFGRRPCERFMDDDPLVMDVGIGLAELTDMVIRADPRHLVSGFIVTDGGRYLGMGSVQDLMREISAMQIEAAKYANPLTQLPGNVPINQTIDNLLSENVPFAVAYCDLDHFKPFNDVYGYARGDEIILLTARILSATVLPETDFIGHIGGDDFVLIFRGAGWSARCEHALKRFGEEVLAFFSPSDIEQGGYLTPNRRGEMEFCCLVSLSIGVVEIAPGAYESHLAVAAAAAEVKKRAKGIAGNSLYVDQRGRKRGAGETKNDNTQF